MTKDELSVYIRLKFQEGKRRNAIKEELLQLGYYEEDIDAIMTQIQHDAIKQLPGISSLYGLIEAFEAKSNLTTTKMTMLIMALCLGILVVLAVGLYFIFDPLGTRSGARDAERASDTAKIQTALGYYYQSHAQYPESITALVPTFLSNMPRDPQSGAEYFYKSLDNDTNYELCASYELEPKQCVTASSGSSQIPIVPTATPTPQYIPQSASDSPSSSSGKVSSGGAD